MLLALLDPDHARCEQVTKWFDSARGGWATCPITQNGFVRIASQPGYSNPVPVALAVDLLRQATMQGSHEFWSCDVAVTDPTQIDTGQVLGSAQLTDAYLLALVVAHGGRFVTLDRRIRAAAVPAAQRDQLVVVGE
ncbi:MAG: hypothetical protein LBJ02_12460 [Bifidobacteriaceae bacterium]|nr:hypothetical protein [Bifidobacteriaceae bacterium]